MKWVRRGVWGHYIVPAEIYRIEYGKESGRWQWVAGERYGTTRTFREAKQAAEAALRKQLGAK